MLVTFVSGSVGGVKFTSSKLVPLTSLTLLNETIPIFTIPV